MYLDHFLVTSGKNKRTPIVWIINVILPDENICVTRYAGLASAVFMTENIFPSPLGIILL